MFLPLPPLARFVTSPLCICECVGDDVEVNQDLLFVEIVSDRGADEGRDVKVISEA